jgi:hypothetical protein
MDMKTTETIRVEFTGSAKEIRALLQNIVTVRAKPVKASTRKYVRHKVPAPRRPWTERDIAVLKANANRMPRASLAKMLGRHPVTLAQMLRKLGVRKVDGKYVV